MEPTLIISSTEAAAYPAEHIGGKAANLSWLTRHGFNVPEFWILTNNAWEKQLLYLGIADWLQKQLDTIQNCQSKAETLKNSCTAIQRRITEAPLFPELQRAIERQIHATSLIKDSFVAVRSSVVGEDGKKDSFAGMMDSFLLRKGLDQIVEAIKLCWASAFSERVIAYRLQKNLPVHAIRMGIIVQKMVAGEVSGVLFTANPTNGIRHQGLLAATYGLGEGLVAGQGNADEFTIDFPTQTILQREIADKEDQTVFDPERGYGTVRKAVKIKDSKTAACLTDAQVLEIARKGLTIAGLAGSPQDIEWTLLDNTFYFLQTRPITHLPPPHPPSGKKTVWDNSNIQESYCGVTTPLTFSFASNAYAVVYEQTMRLMGIPEKVILSHQDMLQNLLGVIKGRIYYNINNWYRGLLLLPSFKQNKADMERMMGLQDPVEFIEDKSLSFGEKVKKMPSLLNTYAKLVAHFRKLPQLVEAFNQLFETEYKSVDRSALHRLSMGELLGLSEQLEEGLLKRWQTPIINDFYVMMYNGKVKRWLEKAGLPDVGSLQNNLLSGEEGMVSTEPTKKLMQLAQEVRKAEGLRKMFDQYENAYLLPALQIHFPGFYGQCLQYIEQYGDRCMGELKLESVTLRQDPSFMFVVIRNYLKRDDLDAERLKREEKRLRSAAEILVFGEIRRKGGFFAPWRFKGDLQKFRQGVKNRENMRLARTRMFGLFRDIYREIGKQFHFYNLLDSPDDVFYLTVEELKRYRDGRLVNAVLKPIVASRRAEFAQYEKEDLPHHFVTHGMTYHHNLFNYPYEDKNDEFNTEEVIRGIGCYPGVVAGNVKLVFSPDDGLDLNGDILCAVRTDPGWTPLFPSCSGIIVERGSTLSHSAVVARELGIPAIVGVKNVTKQLQNNEPIQMDGSSGTIRRLRK